MALPFIVGSVIDIRYTGIGIGSAWGIWIVMFILLLVERKTISKKSECHVMVTFAFLRF